jgi:predicted neutral ceramidase superfamily lipid hydrolase
MRVSGHPSREGSPALPPDLLDDKVTERVHSILKSLGRRVFVLLFATVFAVFLALLYVEDSEKIPPSMRPTAKFVGYACRGILVWSCVAILLKLFRERGGRHIAETFLIAVSFIAGTFFAMICPFFEFVEALMLCSILAIVFHYFN